MRIKLKNYKLETLSFEILNSKKENVDAVALRYTFHHMRERQGLYAHDDPYMSDQHVPSLRDALHYSDLDLLTLENKARAFLISNVFSGLVVGMCKFPVFAFLYAFRTHNSSPFILYTYLDWYAGFYVRNGIIVVVSDGTWLGSRGRFYARTQTDLRVICRTRCRTKSLQMYLQSAPFVVYIM